MSGQLAQQIIELGRSARQASAVVAATEETLRRDALIVAARQLEDRCDEILSANALDLQHAREIELDAALLDRLELTEARVKAMAEGLKIVAALPEVVGVITDLQERPSGIRVGKMRVPLGVIAIVYESRPNVTADAAALCLKSANAVILRGGSEALNSNLSICACLQYGLTEVGLPQQVVQLVPTTDRQAVSELAGLDDYVDILVPRGGKSLIERLQRDATVPMIKHLDGVCHVYIDSHAESTMATRIALNAKLQRFGVCNAMETLLVHRRIATGLLPDLAISYASAGVELRGCPQSRALVPAMAAADEQDWYQEYLGPVLAVRVVDSLEQAIAHINRYGSQHTDTIVTQDQQAAQRFLREVDSSSVIHNASTRFADGFEYGLGAEIGISTDKLHARGPVGLEGLTSQKYVVLGSGQIRED